MKSLAILPLLLGTLLLTATCAEAQTTQKLSAGKVNEYGLVYTLPTTVIDVTVAAERTVKRPGEFYRYSRKLLGVNPITEPSQTCRLTSVTVNARGVADQEERYLVQFEAGTTPYMLIDSNNFPVSINNESVTLPEAPELPQERAAAPTILETPYATQAVTAEMLQSPSSAKRADLAAARIFELRQQRNDIISGQADQMPSDGQAMQLVLDNLSRQEEALMAMFAGTVQTSVEVRTFTIEIPQKSESRTVVCRISDLDGIVEADNLGGDPVYASIKVVSRGELPVNEKGEVKRFPKGGLAYRIPGTAQLTVSYDGDALYDRTIDVAQYGIVFGLDPNIFTDKRAPAYAIFDPVTGAIVELGTVGAE